MYVRLDSCKTRVNHKHDDVLLLNTCDCEHSESAENQIDDFKDDRYVSLYSHKYTK